MLILDSFEKTLENFNIVPINPSGQEFDPEKHEAVSTVNNPGEKDNFVTNTLERVGHLMKGSSNQLLS